jgi:hypothetical protein
MKKLTHANQSTLFSLDYLIFFGLVIVIASVSSWQIPPRLDVANETALMYCEDAYLDRAEYSSSIKTVKVVSGLLGGGATYHIVDEKSFQCPVVASNEMSEECRTMLEVKDWKLVCEGEGNVLEDEEKQKEEERAIQKEETNQHDDIRISAPASFEKVTSPLLMRGEARGTWFFEGDFPIEVRNEEGEVLGEGYATAQGEWMTEEFVPFEGEIIFTIDEGIEHMQGTVIFYKDNPSGISELDDMHVVPVLFVGEEFSTSTPSIIRMEVL